MKKVLILGSTGMLGSAVAREFSDFDGQVIASKRANSIENVSSNIEVREFDAEFEDISAVAFDLGAEDYIINCIGQVKAKINGCNSTDVQRAILINSLLPHRIQNFVAKTGTKVIQIATDCVFSGDKGGYIETDRHDALDVYGKSKSLGEVSSPEFLNIRVSIIGPENSGHMSLFDWVRLQPREATIQGFTDHIWNGITTQAFARLSRGLIESGSFRAGVAHVMPSDQLSKADLVQLIAKSTGRNDITIVPGLSGSGVDRTLNTKDADFNHTVWLNAGYEEVPSIAILLAEIAI